MPVEMNFSALTFGDGSLGKLNTPLLFVIDLITKDCSVKSDLFGSCVSLLQICAVKAE